MPSAAEKKDIEAPTIMLETYEEPVRQIMTALDSKIRFLEKRKEKLDQLASDKSSNNKDDSKLEVLSRQFDILREFEKQVVKIVSDYEKGKAKQKRREEYGRRQKEVDRIKEVILIQEVLTTLGSDQVRADFLAGDNGAPKLTESELEQMDEFYKLVTPSRVVSGEMLPFENQLNEGCWHLLRVTYSKSSKVQPGIAFSYRDLHNLFLRISKCEYMDKLAIEEEGGPIEENGEVVENEEGMQEEEEGLEDGEEVAMVVDEEEGLLGEEEAEEEENEEEVAMVDVPELENPFPVVPNMQSISPVIPSPIPPHQIPTTAAFFSQSNAFVNNPPVQQPPEFIPDAKLDFFQESTIDLESPHMDPAVVMIHGPSSAPPSSNMPLEPPAPIPTQLFLNQNYANTASGTFVDVRPGIDTNTPPTLPGFAGFTAKESILQQQQTAALSGMVSYMSAAAFESQSQPSSKPYVSPSLQQSELEKSPPQPNQTFTNDHLPPINKEPPVVSDWSEPVLTDDGDNDSSGYILQHSRNYGGGNRGTRGPGNGPRGGRGGQTMNGFGGSSNRGGNRDDRGGRSNSFQQNGRGGRDRTDSWGGPSRGGYNNQRGEGGFSRNDGNTYNSPRDNYQQRGERGDGNSPYQRDFPRGEGGNTFQQRDGFQQRDNYRSDNYQQRESGNFRRVGQSGTGGTPGRGDGNRGGSFNRGGRGGSRGGGFSSTASRGGSGQ